ncbi:hypothetical protein Pcinc_006781 [Petrolisthes cinctipes]|uniref:Uncharacterized protein n=1 Tax=Petrolisthes cinctipes TaxID=88211 RepID=A0AAE1L176_PETCI|nr:hypothetical protein Pcinc_006781 [Petrolisthes cinctipes]
MPPGGKRRRKRDIHLQHPFPGTTVTCTDERMVELVVGRGWMMMMEPRWRDILKHDGSAKCTKDNCAVGR